MQHTLTNCVSVVQQQDTDVVWPVVSWPIALAHNLCVRRQSSTEAELIAANAAAKVTKYVQFILHELGYTQTEPTPIYEDNDSAIVNHSRPTDRSRHVEIRYFALQHWRLMKDIILIHLPGVVNPADMLTKALGWVLHHRHAPYLMGHYGNPCR